MKCTSKRGIGGTYLLLNPRFSQGVCHRGVLRRIANGIQGVFALLSCKSEAILATPPSALALEQNESPHQALFALPCFCRQVFELWSLVELLFQNLEIIDDRLNVLRFSLCKRIVLKDQWFEA